ncbi:hypothetical protein GHW91_18300 [Salmonella enterica]|nr:hypothetical protein [Salmonella enterica]
MTTNNHPANGPVSLDRLHQISEILSKAAAQSDGGNLGYAMADAVKVIDGVIAAFGAEPVGTFRKGPCGYHPSFHEDAVPLYAAPPALVVPENCVTAEHRRVIEMLLNVCGAAFELADDSCQQDVDGEECHVVPDDAFQKLSDALDEIENTLPTEDVDRSDVFLAWSAMPRAALKSILQAGNSPVTPDCWISCSERMPDDGRHVIILCDGAFVLYAQYRDGEFFDIVRNGDEFFETQSRNVNDWMPLPEPPQQ